MKKIIFITGITIFCVILIYFIYTAAYCVGAMDSIQKGIDNYEQIQEQRQLTKDETLILQNFKEELDTYVVRATPGLMFLLIIGALLVVIGLGCFFYLVCSITSFLSEMD